MKTIYIPVNRLNSSRRSYMDIVLAILGTFICFGMTVMLSKLWLHSNKNMLFSIICPVNGSVWEGAKVIFTAMLLWYTAEYFLLHINFNRMSGAVLGGITSAMLCQICLVILCTGIIGFCTRWLSWGITFFSIAFGMRNSVIIQRYPGRVEEYSLWYAAFFGVLLYAVLSFSVNPPHIALFFDSVNSVYGFR